MKSTFFLTFLALFITFLSCNNHNQTTNDKKSEITTTDIEQNNIINPSYEEIDGGWKTDPGKYGRTYCKYLFKDGILGYVYKNNDKNKYYLTDGVDIWYYKNLNYAIKALYLSKTGKREFIPKDWRWYKN